MKVQLLAHTPEPEKIVATAAKLCYSSVGVDGIMEGLTSENIDTFLTFLSDIGHESPIEHISFTFAIEGVSRVLTHQLVRHRIASYSQQSQRYVKLDAFEYIVPPAIRQNEEARRLFEDSMEKSHQAYLELSKILEKEAYEKLLEQGLPEKKARNLSKKQGIEDARYVFPNACETKIVVTMNARTLLNFFKHRCCSRAQWEIRALANEMLKLVKNVAPTIFNKAGALCKHGYCPEGVMSCKTS